jgi:hypothetical protein
VTQEQERLREFLVRTIATFEQSREQSRANAGILRRFAKDAPDLFLSCGIQLLLNGPDTEAYRYLTMLLLKSLYFLNHLCDPWTFTYEQALSLSNRLMKADPRFDTRLAQQLPGRHGVMSRETLQGAAAERALEILDEISIGRRVIPILNHLTDYPDKKISSKAAILLGKRLQSLAWARRIIAEGDDRRLRANAIESVWGSNCPAVNKFFRECLSDRDNRVVGNSIVGLHLAGEPDVSQIVSECAGDPKPDFRMTAAWAMGKMADESFVPTLTPLIKDGHPGVRRAALRSLHQIRKSVSGNSLVAGANLVTGDTLGSEA